MIKLVETAKTERRKMLGADIIKILEAENIGDAKCSGIGKYQIKLALAFSYNHLQLSINTVKRIVDELVADGIVECVNPGVSRCLRFRLKEVKDE